ncbi:MAG TPA: DegV family protein [Halanaerobiales bacterium]|nr:DegV family protein [Halanaerobiales bacterium]
MGIKIIVDSACDLPKKILKEYDIEILPFNIHIGDESYKDGIDIQVDQVYQSIRDKNFPKTSQISPEDIKKVFVKNAKAGYDSIYISFSSKMSGAYQLAKLVARDVEEKYKECKIDVLDSKAGSVATGIIAYKAAILADEGKDRKEIIKKVKFFANHIQHVFMLDNLKALMRGGRISKTKSFIGNILKIKPILHVNDGEIELLQKVRGSKKAINKMIDFLKNKSYDLSEQLIGVAHADDLKQAELLKEKIEEIGGNIFCIEKIGSVLGVHLGIGGIGIFFLDKKES